MRMFFSLGVLAFGALSLSGCQGIADKYIDSYFERKGDEAVEQAIDRIVKKKRDAAAKERQGPSLEERLKARVNVSVDGAPVRGPSTAPITIVTFSDFQCPFCKRVLPTVEQVMKEYGTKVKLYFRQNPLPFHDRAMPAAKAALAAHRQGKFWEMHDLLFENGNALTDANFKKWAAKLKMDVKKFEKDMADPALQKQAEADAQFARDNDAGGTPSFFINGVRVVGAQPFDVFKETIEAVAKADNIPLK